MKRKRALILLLALLLTTVGAIAQQQSASQLEPSVARLQQHISYLASDALNGRRAGTQGANDAAHYIAGEFARLGLRPAIERAGASRRGSVVIRQYLQSFPYVAGGGLGEDYYLISGQ